MPPCTNACRLRQGRSACLATLTVSLCVPCAGLLRCAGVCLQAFHPACVGLEAWTPNWWCVQCAAGRMRCFACGGFGAALQEGPRAEEGPGATAAQVKKCCTGSCGRFFHYRCAPVCLPAHPCGTLPPWCRQCQASHGKGAGVIHPLLQPWLSKCHGCSKICLTSCTQHHRHA